MFKNQITTKKNQRYLNIHVCFQKDAADVSQFDSKFTKQTPIDSPDDSMLSESVNQVFLVSAPNSYDGVCAMRFRLLYEASFVAWPGTVSTKVKCTGVITDIIRVMPVLKCPSSGYRNCLSSIISPPYMHCLPKCFVDIGWQPQ